MDYWIFGWLLNADYPTIHKSIYPCLKNTPGLGFEAESNFA